MAHFFLTLKPRCLSTAKARSLVDEQIAVLGPAAVADAARTGKVQRPGGRVLTRRELVQASRDAGSPHQLQEFIDSQDLLFGGVELLATDGEAIGFSMTVGDETFKGPSPAILQNPAVELAKDLIEYRRQICAASERSSIDWPEVGRAYRGLIFGASALFEVFMNRHVVAARSVGQDVSMFEKRLPFNKATDLWFEHFCPDGRDAIKDSKEWNHHQELRQLRNDMIHGNHAVSMISIPMLPETLNHLRSGTGGLMCIIREHQGRAKLGFMLQLANAQEAIFNSYKTGAS